MQLLGKNEYNLKFQKVEEDDRVRGPPVQNSKQTRWRRQIINIKARFLFLFFSEPLNLIQKSLGFFVQIRFVLVTNGNLVISLGNAWQQRFHLWAFFTSLLGYMREIISAKEPQSVNHSNYYYLFTIQAQTIVEKKNYEIKLTCDSFNKK